MSAAFVWNDPAIGIEWPIDFEPLLAGEGCGGQAVWPTLSISPEVV